MEGSISSITVFRSFRYCAKKVQYGVTIFSMLAAMQSDLLRLIDVFLGDAKKPLIALLGPTASGKTALSLELAKYVGAEIINADSRQLYALLDIGTAKIRKEEME